MKTKELYTQDHTIDLSSDREPEYMGIDFGSKEETIYYLVKCNDGNLDFTEITKDQYETIRMHELQEKWEQVYKGRKEFEKSLKSPF